MTSTKEKNEKTDAKGAAKRAGLTGRARQATDRVLQFGSTAAHARTTATHAVEDGVRIARRAATRGRYAAEDLVAAAVLEVRRYPLQAVGLGLAAGITLGLGIGLLLGRIGRQD